MKLNYDLSGLKYKRRPAELSEVGLRGRTDCRSYTDTTVFASLYEHVNLSFVYMDPEAGTIEGHRLFSNPLLLLSRPQSQQRHLKNVFSFSYFSTYLTQYEP